MMFDAEGFPYDDVDPRWLATLVDEVGELAHEVAHCINGETDKIRAELDDIMLVAGSWADALDEEAS